MRVALREAIDRIRSGAREARKAAELARLAADKAAGLRVLEDVAGALEEYQPYHAAQAALLARAGDRQAVAAYDRAIAPAVSAQDAAFLAARRAALVC